MSKSSNQNPQQPQAPPPDQLERNRALNHHNSVLVQAPAGSGKTDLLTRRFLALLAQVENPAQIVAITFTKAAAAEMRHRILGELQHAADEIASYTPPAPDTDAYSMSSLARRALLHAQALNWNLLDQPAQLRIATIDSFCREIALQQPLLSNLGDGLGIYEQPDVLYRRAARQTLEQIDSSNPQLSAAIERLLLWRDNSWYELENQLIEMLKNRDRWMQEFVLARDADSEEDWDHLRRTLEQSFQRAIVKSLASLSRLLDHVPGSREQAHTLARFACQNGASALFQHLAELADFPNAVDSHDLDALEEAHHCYLCLATLLLTNDGDFRKALNKNIGFLPEHKQEKAQLLALIASLAAVPGLESALATVRTLPPTRYTEDDWQIVRASFTLLRHAAAQLHVVFAEAGAVDYTQVAQSALAVLKSPTGEPTDAALAVADNIRHLLVDEFQDTSRRQHELLGRLIAAWPDRADRTCFVVGDPMQSIYFFREADAELFPRVKSVGLEIPGPTPLLVEPLLFDSVALTSNFRTSAPLVESLNQNFKKIFEENDGSGIEFAEAQPARVETVTTLHNTPGAPGPVVRRGGGTGEGFAKSSPPEVRSLFNLHLRFQPQLSRFKSNDTDDLEESEDLKTAQVNEIVELIRSHSERIEQARAAHQKYRVAVLGRTKNALAPIAKVLREQEIPFRAVDLEQLSAQPEILDALALARAILNPLDRVAWLGVLRAPWCGLSLADLHIIASTDHSSISQSAKDPDRFDGAQDVLKGTGFSPYINAPELSGASAPEGRTVIPPPVSDPHATPAWARPIPDLLRDRVHLLSPDGQLAAARVLDAIALAPATRFAHPARSLGTWLEQLWLALGGAACVDATSRVNLNLLWQALDSLPNGEQDLLGPALDEALGKLTAQPDPDAHTDTGVQLMTIHKSKGLEFEVVIIPELQARSRQGQFKMLSWLERGLLPDEIDLSPDGSEEITEFLVAPLQSKGSDRSTTRLWVDRVYSDRESQEMRRILYVAATRAREELHIFARPAVKHDKDGEWTLAKPAHSLLKTAWPGLEEEINTQFEAWKQAQAEPESEIVESLAASADSNLIVMPSPAQQAPQPTILRRLPTNYGEAAFFTPAPTMGAPGLDFQTWDRTKVGAPGALVRRGGGTGDGTLYQRHEGGLISRALGTAVHALLQQLTRLRAASEWPKARAALKQYEPRIAAQIRASGIDPKQAASLAAEAVHLALKASDDANGQWILSPHADEATEVRWVGVLSGSLRTVQVDRVFRAGPTPLADGQQAWWIVDYKTAHADATDLSTALPQLREIFAPQLEAYAQVLRNLHGQDAQIRTALYYPRTQLLDWWEV